MGGSPDKRTCLKVHLVRDTYTPNKESLTIYVWRAVVNTEGSVMAVDSPSGEKGAACAPIRSPPWIVV
jgi:hypothetical protein